ncbi:bor protein, partial [Klebsiella sp. AS10]|uniref:Bor family protein n=1 Tax=Klebsiella sp. AS10 TaxID=936564 RepID=UPI0004523F84
MKKLIMVVFAAAAISGCAQQSFSVNPGVTVQPQQVTTHHFFVSGIGQSKQIDAAKVCGGAGLAPIFPYTFYHLTHDW